MRREIAAFSIRVLAALGAVVVLVLGAFFLINPPTKPRAALIGGAVRA